MAPEFFRQHVAEHRLALARKVDADGSDWRLRALQAKQPRVLAVAFFPMREGFAEKQIQRFHALVRPPAQIPRDVRIARVGSKHGWSIVGARDTRDQPRGAEGGRRPRGVFRVGHRLVSRDEDGAGEGARAPITRPGISGRTIRHGASPRRGRFPARSASCPCQTRASDRSSRRRSARATHRR